MQCSGACIQLYRDKAAAYATGNIVRCRGFGDDNGARNWQEIADALADLQANAGDKSLIRNH
jgi:hypothetical protein